MEAWLTVFQASDEHRGAVHDLFHEYLHWVCSILQREYDLTFDPGAILEHDMESLRIFMPPGGRLLLVSDEDGIAGCACVRTIGPRLAEIKRMYVRPAWRRRGIGRALVDAAVAEMRAAGYTRMRLDSARFMAEAQALYRSAGFRDTAPYPESEIPPEYWAHWVFMELPLDA